jgi:hypothetical protein
MSKEHGPILYDAPATLHKWPSLEARRHLTGETIHSRPVYNGTLAGCIREFLAKPISQRPLYEIFTDRQTGLRDSILSSNYILEISGRADFPKDGGT